MQGLTFGTSACGAGDTFPATPASATLVVRGVSTILGDPAWLIRGHGWSVGTTSQAELGPVVREDLGRYMVALDTGKVPDRFNLVGSGR